MKKIKCMTAALLAACLLSGCSSQEKVSEDFQKARRHQSVYQFQTNLNDKEWLTVFESDLRKISQVTIQLEEAQSAEVCFRVQFADSKKDMLLKGGETARVRLENNAPFEIFVQINGAGNPEVEMRGEFILS